MAVDSQTSSTGLEHRTQERRMGASPTLLVFASILPPRDPPRAVPIGKSLLVGRPSAATSQPGRLDLRDKLLSRRHLRIVREKGGYTVDDAGSLNGTYLEGRQLTGPRPLAEGNVVAFGRHAAVFRRVSVPELRALDQEAIRPFGPVPTLSPALALTLSKLRRLAKTETELLLVGETGVGKEVYARAVHAASGRKGPFIAINCAALPPELVESELFGYARGAHSTATESKAGLVQTAHGGTLLLDEIGELPVRLQAKIFRFLQERQIVPLGSTTFRHVDVRVIAATSRPAEGGSVEGMRPDLLARLGGEPIVIPPLRDRPEDLGALIPHFVRQRAREIEPAAFRALCLYHWPLNVRELENVLERGAALGEDGVITLENLPRMVQDAAERRAMATGRRSARAAPRRDELESLLRDHRGNVASLARALDRQWNVVWRWIVKQGLEPGRYR